MDSVADSRTDLGRAFKRAGETLAKSRMRSCDEEARRLGYMEKRLKIFFVMQNLELKKHVESSTIKKQLTIRN